MKTNIFHLTLVSRSIPTDSFWYKVLETSIPLLLSGLVIAGIGLIIWKFQQNYTKRHEVYVKSVANISQVKRFIENLRCPMPKFSIADFESDIFKRYQQNRELFDTLEKNKIEFSINFGDEYEKDFDIFLITMDHLLFTKSEIGQELEKIINPEAKKETFNFGNSWNDTPKDETYLTMNKSYKRIQNALEIKKFWKY